MMVRTAYRLVRSRHMADAGGKRVSVFGDLGDYVLRDVKKESSMTGLCVAILYIVSFVGWLGTECV